MSVFSIAIAEISFKFAQFFRNITRTFNLAISENFKIAAIVWTPSESDGIELKSGSSIKKSKVCNQTYCFALQIYNFALEKKTIGTQLLHMFQIDKNNKTWRFFFIAFCTTICSTMFNWRKNVNGFQVATKESTAILKLFRPKQHKRLIFPSYRTTAFGKDKPWNFSHCACQLKQCRGIIIRRLAWHFQNINSIVFTTTWRFWATQAHYVSDSKINDSIKLIKLYRWIFRIKGSKVFEQHQWLHASFQTKTFQVIKTFVFLFQFSLFPPLQLTPHGYENGTIPFNKYPMQESEMNIYDFFE